MPTLVQPPSDFVVPRRVVSPKRLSQRIPWLFPIAVRYHQTRQQLRWLLSKQKFTQSKQSEPLSNRVKLHKSLLLKELAPEEMELQYNKVNNLRIACAETDGVLIRPGETFSFNQTVGEATEAKGYLTGMKLSNGKAVPGVGGGICQLANLIHWMVMHSPLKITARSEHSFDPFPDKGRVLPWGVGCSIVWNYVDLVVHNDTDTTFQLFTKVGERYLEGELRADRELPHSYKVFARNEQFILSDEGYFRRNEIWRSVIDRRTGNTVGEEELKRNCALVIYEPKGEVIDCRGLSPDVESEDKVHA